MSVPFPPSQAVPNGSAPNDNTPYDEREIHEILRKIRAEEVKGGRGHTFLFNIPIIRSAYLYIELVITENFRYFSWLYVTWKAVFLRTWDSIFHGAQTLPPESEESESDDVGDWLAYVLFALAGTVILPFILFLCLVARFPPFTRTYYAWSNLNSGNPDILKSLTVRQAEAANKALSVPVEFIEGTDKKRYFNYDIAKILLQIAAVIYEHENDAIRNAAFGGTDSFGNGFEFLEATGDASIRRFCRQFGIEYQPISELNNKSTAFCAVFWDPRSSWIVVALKGTGVVEFGEWLSDLDASMVPCGDYIDGFQLVHKGFKGRVFPDKGGRPSESQDQPPYNTISQSVKALVAWLIARLPAGQKVNVWFTGHSLGCATATLIYSRMLMRPEEIGENGILRDAYLFAAPIVADPQSVNAFNDKMFKEGAPSRTMWRITSNNDFVATGLPEYGDYLQILDPKALKTDRKNDFFFSHFGSEIVLYNYPHSSDVTGNHITRDHEVVIDSVFTREEVAAFHSKKTSQLGEYIRERTASALQQIPLLGRFLAHSTVNYWDQLDRAALGECEWTVY